MKNLVIVESPTKARTLSRYLGEGYRIVASMGHIRDLPKSELGVDVEKNFAPHYIIPRDKQKQVKLLRSEAVGRDTIFLATDPDREGEAIAYHVKYLLSKDQKIKSAASAKASTSAKATADESAGKQNTKFKRIVFHEITKQAILAALERPREIDLHLFDAQQARRVLDRLVGYKLSPLLWYKIKKGLSAGRVQSVAVRLIVDREREIEAFKPVEYWVVQAQFSKQTGNSFIATLSEIKGEKAEITNKGQADELLKTLQGLQYGVKSVEIKEVRRFAPPPFTTSTLQQSGSNRLGISSKQTMRIAQGLYEEGLISYHRTDSLNVSEQAISFVRSFITQSFGVEFVPEKPIFYKTKSRGAQEAHEAIRPTDVSKTPEELSLGGIEAKVYDLIRSRFLASQMKEALYQQTSVKVAGSEYIFKAVGTLVAFPGWRAVYGVKKDDNVSESEDEVRLPPLITGEPLNLDKLIPLQKFTQPPPRYTEASLIKALEEHGIGRPSTYAPTISTIQDRAYVIREDRKLKPTELGAIVTDFLVKYFPNIVDLEFTAGMEENLDKIARGESEWVPVIADFYGPFEKEIEAVQKTAERVEMPVEETGEKCPQCGNPLVIRLGKFGKFIACSTFPTCKYTKNLVEKINIPCPKCGGDIVLKKTRRGKPFYGCSNYPKCDFASWKKPFDPSTLRQAQGKLGSGQAAQGKAGEGSGQPQLDQGQKSVPESNSGSVVGS